MLLPEIIIQKIREEGPLSFHDYMEYCLYHPDAGYYNSEKNKIGQEGDFYTSSNISPLFGIMIGKQLEKMWNSMGKRDFTIVEYGAGTGRLCHDILDYLENNRKFYSRLRYIIIEKSASLRRKQKSFLTDKVAWCNSIRDVPDLQGCILSNELVDNFSVHRVVMKKKLMEVFVEYEKGFVEVLQPAGEMLVNYLRELNIKLPEDYCTEINLDALAWISDISHALKKGYLLTIDYGNTSMELYSRRRKEGTLRCYYKHTMNDQPYLHIGEQDITAQVNFSALSHWGRINGLDAAFFGPQAALLLFPGWEDCLRQILLQQQDAYLNLRQYANLKYTLLFEMGQKFNVLIQHKAAPPLSLPGLNGINRL